MREQELRLHAICDLCNNPIGASGIPLFWTVTVERHGLKIGALRRQQGLGVMIGAQLASIMGPDEEMTVLMMDPVKLTVCETCSTSSGKAICVAALAERAAAETGKSEP